MSKKKIIRNAILVLAILILMVILIVSLGDIKTIWKELINANVWIVLLAVAALLLYAFFNQLSLISLTKFRYKEIKYVDCYTISGSEYFFNALTPFSSGGQPFQAYAFKRKGMSLADSTSVLLINFIAYQTCLNVIAAVFIIIYYGKVKEQVSGYIWLLILGFSINLLIMVGLLSIGLFKTVGRFFLKLFDLICKIKPLRRFQSRHDRFETYIINMQLAFKEITKNLKLWVWVILTKVVAFGIYYSIPFFALYAVGVKVDFADLPYVMALTAFTLTISAWVPTPGGAGGVEAAFALLFSPFVVSYGYDQETAKSVSLAIMLIWRMLTYYLLILYGFILYLVFEKRDKSYSFLTNDKKEEEETSIESDITVDTFDKEDNIEEK